MADEVAETNLNSRTLQSDIPENFRNQFGQTSGRFSSRRRSLVHEEEGEAGEFVPPFIHSSGHQDQHQHQAQTGTGAQQGCVRRAGRVVAKTHTSWPLIELALAHYELLSGAAASCIQFPSCLLGPRNWQLATLWQRANKDTRTSERRPNKLRRRARCTRMKFETPVRGIMSKLIWEARALAGCC